MHSVLLSGSWLRPVYYGLVELNVYHLFQVLEIILPVIFPQKN